MISSQTHILNRHDFTDTFTAEYDKGQNQAIITPSSGKKIKVTGFYVSTEGASAATEKVRIYFSTTGDTIATVYPGTSPESAKVKPIVVEGGVDEAVSLESTLADDQNYFVAVNYREEG